MKKIPIFENYYITLTGKIFNLSNMKWLKLTRRFDGYYIVGINKKSYLVHRLLGITFLPKKEGKTIINHIDGNKSNNNIFNLEWCNQSENIQHAYNIGLNKTTERQRQNGRNNIKIALKASNIAKRKKIIDLSNGKIYDSAKEASTELGYNKNTIVNYLNGHRINKTTLQYV